MDAIATAILRHLLVIDMVSRRLLSCLVILSACASVSGALAQPAPAPAPAAPPAPESPNPPPAPAADVVGTYVALITAKPATVETLRVRSAEFASCRLRLYIAPPVTDRMVGIDYHVYRGSGQVHAISLSAASPVFRERLNQLLNDPISASPKSEESGVRIVDVWCQRVGPGPAYVPLLAKVWSNSLAADIPHNDSTTPVPGRVCHDDEPAIAECQQAFDYSPPVFKNDIEEISAPASTISALAEALTAHRSSIAALIAKQTATAPTTKRVPGGAVIAVNSTHALGEEACVRAATVPRILAGGESFIGLAPDAKEGTVTLRFKTPFPIGGGVLQAPARITRARSSVDVEVSKDGMEWTRVYVLDPARGRRGSAAWKAAGSYPLPSSLRGATKLQIRARLASSEDAQSPEQMAARALGPRFLDAVFRIPRTTELRIDDGLLRNAACHDQVDGTEKPLQVIVQPERLGAEDVSAMVQAGAPELDFYSACDLDEAASGAIGAFPGTARFWSPADWQDHPPAWLTSIGSGGGRLEFPGLKNVPEGLAAAVVAGKKSVAFPLVEAPSAELLQTLATCSGTLALDGVKDLSAAQAAALSGYRGPRLSLAALRAVALAESPSPALAAAFVSASGTCTVTGTTGVAADTAAALAGGEKHLVFDGLTSLDPQLAAVLAASRNGLFLDGLTILSQAAADPLLAYAGPLLSLRGLTRVECGVDALAEQPRGSAVRLRDIIRQAMPEAAPAEPQAQPGDREAELEAILRDASAKGLATPADKDRFIEQSKSGGPSLAAIVDRLRELVPLLPPDRGRLDLGMGRPLAAFVESPGVFGLRQAGGRTDRRSRIDKSVFQTLARGRKHLDLGSLTTLDDAEAAAALATSENVISLDGLTSVSPEIATALAKYAGPFLSLNGLDLGEAEAAELVRIFEPLVREDRASLASLGMLNVGGMREFATESADSLADKQKKMAKQFIANSGSRDWTGAGGRGKGRVSLVLRNELVFETAAGASPKIARASLSPVSGKTVTTLADLGKELSFLRTKAKIEAAAPAGGNAAAATAP